MRIKQLSILACAFMFTLVISSCSKKNIKKADATGEEDTITIPAIDIEETIDMLNTEANIRGTQFVEQENIQTIFFEFDKYNLSDKNRNILSANAEIIKSHKEWIILVEGHCDDKGTIEYNLALGQKRAKQVRDYYIRLGIMESAMGTISYGEENPSCMDETEVCWAQNRRSETKVRNQ
ncbi:MAG: OmpA family protein [Elusimicrobiales bacterium]|nr:OmpA family protein [Elusimicrobiales bacterium]MCK5107046.1 OmpA family protein [Elusimicrobiales bacterium]